MSQSQKEKDKEVVYLGTAKGRSEMVPTDEPAVFLLNILGKVKGRQGCAVRLLKMALTLGRAARVLLL